MSIQLGSYYSVRTFCSKITQEEINELGEKTCQLAFNDVGVEDIKELIDVLYISQLKADRNPGTLEFIDRDTLPFFRLNTGSCSKKALHLLVQLQMTI